MVNTKANSKVTSTVEYNYSTRLGSILEGA